MTSIHPVTIDLESLSASGVFRPPVAPASVWEMLEESGALPYGELIANFPEATLEDFNPAFFDQDPQADHSKQIASLKMAVVDDTRFPVVTRRGFNNVLDPINRPKPFPNTIHRSYPWTYLQHHLERQHGALAHGDCQCGVKVFSYIENFSTPSLKYIGLAPDINTVEDMLMDPEKYRLIKGFSEHSRSRQKWLYFVDYLKTQQ